MFATILLVLSGLVGLMAGYRTVSIKTEAQLIQARSAVSMKQDVADQSANTSTLVFDTIEWHVPRPSGYTQNTVVNGYDSQSTINDNLVGNLRVSGANCTVTVNGTIFGCVMVYGTDCKVVVKGGVYNDVTLGGYDNKLVIERDARSLLSTGGANNTVLVRGNYCGKATLSGRDNTVTVRGAVDANSRINVSGTDNSFRYGKLLRGAIVTATGYSARQEQLK